MNPSPQKGLPLRWRDKRAPACHDKCPDYIGFKSRQEERKALERKNREDFNAVNEFKAKQSCKAMRRKMRER